MIDVIKAVAVASVLIAVSLALSIIIGLLAPIAFFAIVAIGAWFIIKLLKDDDAPKTKK